MRKNKHVASKDILGMFSKGLGSLAMMSGDYRESLNSDKCIWLLNLPDLHPSHKLKMGIWNGICGDMGKYAKRTGGGYPGNTREILLLPFAGIGFVGRTRGTEF